MKKYLFVSIPFLILLFGCKNISVSNELQSTLATEPMNAESSEIEHKNGNDPTRYQSLFFDGISPDYCVDLSFYGCDGDNIYPIGWSKDGKFAYFYQFMTDARGDGYMELRILDTNSDQTVYSFNECDKPENIDGDFCFYDVEDFLNRNSVFINQKLKEHRIIKTGETTLKSFPLEYGDELISSDVTIGDKANKKIDEDRYQITQKTELKLQSDKRGERTVKVFNNDSYDYWEPCENSCPYPRQFSFQYYLQNPFEKNMLLVFYIREYAGWEGPPNPISISLISIDLTEI